MNPGRALLALFVALAMLIPTVPVQAQDRAGDAVADREILVMLRLAPPHYRPNSAYSGDYGDSASRTARRRIAMRIAHRNGFELVDGWPMPLVGVDCYTMRVPANIPIESAIAQVSKDPSVAWSEPMRIYHTRGGRPTSAPPTSDPLFRVEPAAAAWRLADLHRVATGRGVSVAVIDSKIEVRHPDLAGQFAADQDFVGNARGPAEQHGTGVAGVIAAKANNGIGIAGVAPDARLMALRACWQSGSAAAGPTICDSLSLAKALHFAIEHDAKVINLSLSGPPDLLLAKLIDIALARRASIVAAYDPTLPKGGFPASQPGVIAVADESLPSLPSLVYGAPGRDVPTTQPGGRWYLVNGSSYAVAHVSGLLALVRGQHQPPASPLLVASRAGGGTIDACATLLRTTRACDCSCAVARDAAAANRR